jgi:hypothetical protein
MNELSLKKEDSFIIDLEFYIIFSRLSTDYLKCSNFIFLYVICPDTLGLS